MIGDPTPEEIRIRAAEIRAEWDERTERERRVQKTEVMTIPYVSAHLSRDRMEQD